MSTLHIFFGLSAEGTMKMVLSQRGSADATVGIHEDWSWGPIGEHRLAERIEYMRKEDPTPWEDYWDALPKSHAEFWDKIAGWSGDRLIWLGSSCAAEIAGYLAYLDKFAHVPAKVIRPDDYLPDHPRYGKAGAIGRLNADEVAEALDHAPRRLVSEDSALFGRWNQLVDENAMLRVAGDGSLVSAPIDHHDHFVLKAARPEWTRYVRVVGDALGATFDAGVWVNSEFLFSRLAHLVDAGVLEADGDVRAWTDEPRRSDARVRLAST